jgi:hypothetical protein
LLEDFSKGCGDLFECTGNGLVLALVKNVDEILNGFTRRVQFGTTFCEGAALAGEVLVLFKRLLVDVGEALERLVGLGKLLRDLPSC